MGEGKGERKKVGRVFCFRAGLWYNQGIYERGGGDGVIVEGSYSKLNKKISYMVVIGMILAVVVGGCGQKPVGVVNGERISEAEFMARLKKAAGEQILRTMVDRELVEQEFAASGLQVAEGETSKRLAELQGRFPTPEAFAEFLDSRGTTVEELEEELEFNMKLEMLASKDVAVSEKGIREFYEQYSDRYDKPLRVVIREIVLSSKEEAEKVAKEAKGAEADFAALATQYSLSPGTRQYGGKRPETPIGQLYPEELRWAAQDVKVGEVSEPINADEQWYVIKVEERKAAEKGTFEKVKEQVTEDYKRAQAEPVDQLVNRLRQKAVVSIVAPEFQGLNELYQAPEDIPAFGPEEESPTESENTDE